MTSPIDIRDGRVNVGRGSGVRVFAARRSAINAAFSLVFGRMKTDMLSCVGPRYSAGSGNNRPSLIKEDNMFWVMRFGGLTPNWLVGVKLPKFSNNESRIKEFQMCSGIGHTPAFPKPLHTISSVIGDVARFLG